MDHDWLKTQFALHPDKTKADLARALGLEPPAVSKMIAGRRQIKAAEYIAMRVFFGLPVDGARAAAGATAAGAYVISPLDDPGLRDRAGASAGDNDGHNWVMPASLFEARTSAPPDKIRIFPVHGDAMLPDFRPGEQVLVDLSDTRPSPAGTFVVSDGMGHILRQCEYVPHSAPPEIRLSALNVKYTAYVLPLDRAGIVGRVLAKLEWL